MLHGLWGAGGHPYNCFFPPQNRSLLSKHSLCIHADPQTGRTSTRTSARDQAALQSGSCPLFRSTFPPTHLWFQSSSRISPQSDSQPLLSFPSFPPPDAVFSSWFVRVTEDPASSAAAPAWRSSPCKHNSLGFELHSSFCSSKILLEQTND